MILLLFIPSFKNIFLNYFGDRDGDIVPVPGTGQGQGQMGTKLRYYHGKTLKAIKVFYLNEEAKKRDLNFDKKEFKVV